MKQTTAPVKTPSPANPTKSQSAGTDKSNLGLTFVVGVLDISWQMAIVVLVPVIGGYELDKQLKTTPALTIIGFILAMIGTFMVAKKAFDSYGNRTLGQPKGSK